MRPFVLLLAALSLGADMLEEIDTKGKIALEHQNYLDRPSGNYASNSGILGEMENVYDGESWYLRSWLKGFKDFEEEERDFIRFDELYAMYRSDVWESAMGRRIFFWGALEANNVVDILNPTDPLYDPFDSDAKKGVYAWTLSYFFDASQIDLYIKAGEENSNIGNQKSPYNGYGDLYYDPELDTSKGADTPSYYLKYSGSTDWDYPLDYAFAFMHGYDSLRYTYLNANVNFQQRAFRSNQYLMWHTWVVDATLVKLETKYADVLDDERVSDYLQSGIGVEHTLEQLYAGSDLGLIAEYYTHHEFEETLLDRDSLGILFQNDLFLGLRLTLNDIDSTELLGGGIFDLSHEGEQSWYLEYSRRIGDDFTLESEIRYIEPGKDQTRFQQLQRHTRFDVSVAYNF